MGSSQWVREARWDQINVWGKQDGIKPMSEGGKMGSSQWMREARWDKTSEWEKQDGIKPMSERSKMGSSQWVREARSDHVNEWGRKMGPPNHTGPQYSPRPPTIYYWRLELPEARQVGPHFRWWDDTWGIFLEGERQARLPWTLWLVSQLLPPSCLSLHPLKFPRVGLYMVDPPSPRASPASHNQVVWKPCDSDGVNVVQKD